jgi:NAD(P)-dependent dehydrogenase (short-subunit alcohol dehydrogenase family)
MSDAPQTALIVGASRGLGLGLAREYARRGWRVIGTVRKDNPPTQLHKIADKANIRIETVDINFPDQVAALRRRLAGEELDLLFVNAAVANGPGETVPESSTEAFTTILITNALSPLRVIEAFADLVQRNGVIAAMSSQVGSVANNTRGGWELYRASKASLNTLLRSFAVRCGDGRTILAVVPGWVRTDMGGPHATLDVETSVCGIADMIAARRGQPGSFFVDYQNREVAW